MNQLRRGGHKSIRLGFHELAYDIKGMLALGEVATAPESIWSHFWQPLGQRLCSLGLLPFHEGIQQATLAHAHLADAAVTDSDLLHDRSGDAKVDRSRQPMLRVYCSLRSCHGCYG